MKTKSLAIASAIVIAVMTAALAACIITMGDDPDMLIAASSFLGSTLSLIVLVIACLALRKSPSERYSELYGDPPGDSPGGRRRA